MGISSLWSKLFRHPSAALARKRRKLDALVRSKSGSFQLGGDAWKCYQQAIGLAMECGRDALAAVVMDFDPIFPAGPTGTDSTARKALTLLLAVDPVPRAALEAALRLAYRQGEVAQIKDVEQRVCLSLARGGDSDWLVAKLLDRRKRGLLVRQDIEQIIQAYLDTRAFEVASPWAGFFSQLPQDQLPRVHQVHALLGRYSEAANIAEERGDYRSALRYLLESPGLEAALRAIALSEERVRDPESAIQAHRNAAEALWHQGNHMGAAEHFEKAGDLDRLSDCYLSAGRIADAIKSRVEITSAWLTIARDKTDNTVRHLVETGNPLKAIRLLHSAADSLRAKANADSIHIEVARLEDILRNLVRTARASLTEEARGAAPGAEVFRRWSAVEEASGNFLEAGIQAEFGHDYLTATMMFEKAGAYGQALRAFEQSPRNDQVEQKAELLEQGGDLFMVGLLYESLGQTDRAITLFELSGDFPRAARLLRTQLGDENSALDDRYLRLATNAGVAEDVAQLCWDLARKQSPIDRGRFLQRIKQLIKEGYVAGAWSERVTTEMSEIDESARSAFSIRAMEWMEKATQDVLSRYIDILGIDLGTSNTVVALYDRTQGQPEIVELEGRALIPSIFAINNAGLEVVGAPVTAWLGKAPRAVVTKAKLAMGTGQSYKVGDRLYQPEEISARILQCAQQRASEYLRRQIADRMSVLASGEARTSASTDWIEQHLREHPPSTTYSQAVITVPAYFNDVQKQATRSAAEIAGIKLLRLIHEPTAACLALRQCNQDEETILVVDLGAGTLDLSLIKAGNGVYEVLEIEGDANLGSSDLDKLLFDHFHGFATTSRGRELDRPGKLRLLAACEELKIELSLRTSWEIDLLSLFDNNPFHLELTRNELLGLAHPWLDRIRTTCRKVTSKPDRLLLVGGGTLMPAVRDCIRDVYRLDANTVVDPLTAVARGAAIQAAILAGCEKDKLLLDATPFSLGIKVSVSPGKYSFSRVIPRHTTIPTSRSEKYTTVEDNQTTLNIEIYQGESSDPDKNFKIGEFRFQGLLLAKAGIPDISVTFAIDANCLLTVTARDAATKREYGISIGDSHLLTPAQMTALKQRLQKTNQLEEVFRTLARTAGSITESLSDHNLVDLPQLQSQLRDQVAEFEQHASRYAPAASDNEVLLDLYNRRDSVSVDVQLLIDRWYSLRRSATAWLAEASQARSDSDGALDAAHRLVATGESIAQRLGDAVRTGAHVAKLYRLWTSVLLAVPINPAGDPEHAVEYFLRRSNYEEALSVFQRFNRPLERHQVELGLEIFAKKRDRRGYSDLLNENAIVLGVEWPDFARLNNCIRTFAASVVLVQCETANGRSSGTGFAIGRREIATNLHVILASDGRAADPEVVSVVTKGGHHRVTAIDIPRGAPDDVAVLRLAETEADFRPMRLGFSETVELGERVLTVGFPAPRDNNFEENLYCDTGLVNRITKSELCSERVFEVSMELQGGISGAPMLNEFGEVIGLLTFSMQRERVADGGYKTTERSYYAIPVEILRRLVKTW